uniref:Uncharacterized protein n=1 Tax=Arundo donax TaxID=35708 RepID=A0A0A9DUX7_ARUDO
MNCSGWLARLQYKKKDYNRCMSLKYFEWSSFLHVAIVTDLDERESTGYPKKS